MRLNEILKGVSTRHVQGDMERDIRGVSYDSRKTEHGDLFIAMRGFKFDGKQFIDDAVRAGAVAVVADGPPPKDLPQNVSHVEVEQARTAHALIAANFFGHPTEHFKLVGVTGTNGKTTTTFLIESIFRHTGCTTGLIGTVEYRIADNTTEAARTTPEATDLQRFFKTMVEHKVTHAVMEVSSHAISLERTLGCHFDVAVWTNISQDHLDFHDSFTEYRDTKKRLLEDTLKRGGSIVVNVDDPSGRQLVRELKGDDRKRCIAFGFHECADLKAIDSTFTPAGAQFKATFQGETFDVTAPLAGRINVENSLAAMGAAQALGFSWNDIIAGLKSAKTAPGRLEPVPNTHDIAVFVDYAHTDAALANVLLAIQDLRKELNHQGSRIITVFGCGGDRDKKKRPLMGESAFRHSDLVVVTSDNPRTEEPDEIIADILEYAPLRKAIVDQEAFVNTSAKVACVNPDRRQAIATALKAARAGDFVVIAGKGHETYQEINGVQHPFHDVDVASTILEGM